MERGDRFACVDRSCGCLLISSPQGHSGKTVVTIGLCNLLTKQGLSVQPFKKGPDYIDPSWLTIAAGRNCRNLDFFLIPKEKLIRTFERACEEADLAIVEGAMGLYDGLDSQQTTAEIGHLLDVPIVLVVNTGRMTGSIAAMVKGYQLFRTDIRIEGVILNYVSGDRHEKKLREAVEEHCEIPVLGAIPRDPDLMIAERHLGLIPSNESGEAALLVEQIGHKLEPHLNLDQLLMVIKKSKPGALRRISRNGISTKPPAEKESPGVRIGVMHDRVFNFYYPENLEALNQKNADLIFIDSLRDRLPLVDGLYIGGGFPEFFLKELEENRPLRREIAEAIDAGLPVYAECAGLMYLCRKIHWQGRSHEMVGVIPAEVELSNRPEGHGYVIAEVTEENPFFPMGVTIRGHEFHHSSISHLDGLRFAYQIRRGHGIDGKRDGIVYKNVFASYTHLHALGTPEWAGAFVTLALKRKNGHP
jgi:cobyrinic acid a,c-diamide synthase